MIGRLADVESRAEEMVFKAQSEARELVIEARSQGDVRYNARCDEVRAAAREQLVAADASTKKDCDDALEDYRVSVVSSQLDVASFNVLLDKTLFG